MSRAQIVVFSSRPVAKTMILSLFKRSSAPAAARSLYGDIVRQARNPAFYGPEAGVADSEDGRYDMILLILERLNRISPAPAALKQDLFDVLFEDLDLNLREMGYGDTGVKIRIQKMVEGFYGRMAAYREGLAAGEEGLAAALRRNLYRNTAPEDAQVARLTAYLQAQSATLAALDDQGLLGGRAAFADPSWAAAGGKA